MGLCTPSAPIKRLELMAEDIADDPLQPHEPHGERIGLVIGNRGHRQTNHNPSSRIEFSRGQNNQRVDVLHFPASLGIAVNPIHVSPVRAP